MPLMKRKIVQWARLTQQRMDSSSNATFEVFEQSRNVNGDAFGLEDGEAIGKKAAKTDTTDQQQLVLKELREKFANKEKELTQTKQMCKSTELEKKALEDKVEQLQKLRPRRNSLQAKVAETEQTDIQKQKEMDTVEDEPQQGTSKTTVTNRNNVSAVEQLLKSKNDQKSILMEIHELKKHEQTLYGQPTSKSSMNESTKLYFAILNNWVRQQRRKASAEAGDVITLQTFVDCQDAIKSLGLYKNTTPHELLRRWNSSIKLRRPIEAAQVEKGIFTASAGLAEGDEDVCPVSAFDKARLEKAKLMNAAQKLKNENMRLKNLFLKHSLSKMISKRTKMDTDVKQYKESLEEVSSSDAES